MIHPLDQLRTQIPFCTKCELYQLDLGGPVPPIGPHDAQIALFGRNPGIVEAREKVPFIGPAGIELNNGLLRARILRTQCWISNCVKCPTVNPQCPKATQYMICAHTWLLQELAALQHLRIIVTFGKEALQFFEPTAPVQMLSGTSWQISLPDPNQPRVTLFCSVHPASVLHNPGGKQRYYTDMLELGKVIREQTTIRCIGQTEGGYSSAT